MPVQGFSRRLVAFWVRFGNWTGTQLSCWELGHLRLCATPRFPGFSIALSKMFPLVWVILDDRGMSDQVAALIYELKRRHISVHISAGNGIILNEGRLTSVIGDQLPADLVRINDRNLWYR